MRGRFGRGGLVRGVGSRVGLLAWNAVVVGVGSRVGLFGMVLVVWFEVWLVGVGSRVGLWVCGVWFEV